MILSFRNPITSALLKALQFFRMADVTPNSIPFERPDPRGTDIERYISNMENGYNANGDPYGGAAKRMKYYRVKELYRCKELTELGHEYISAMVVDPDSKLAFYIVFERFRGPGDPDKPPPAESANE